ncbi:hypothetical protein DESHY_20125 [Desulforamulus hydrothermalis Lam5 = DSM 18033]|uniref:Uncharacterized protein n=2 Tax=Desulforamulus TaxID=2916693 RepID=K8EI05_9FIRM|nr:hypothetical protein DESHY_20125 [Desulforamulus hydrothermalis Lam5 = DSM 18033]SHH43847.1 hypothetical protein SAMN02745177_02559 [Desulforamulus hydrothermalis Lam5 = DSM 18033]
METMIKLGDNCILPSQVDGNESNGYTSPSNLKEYTLNQEELAEIHKKYGPPGQKLKKENFFVSAKRSVPLIGAR